MGMPNSVVTVAAMAIEAKKDTTHLRILPKGLSGLHPTLSNKTLTRKPLKCEVAPKIAPPRAGMGVKITAARAVMAPLLNDFVRALENMGWRISCEGSCGLPEIVRVAIFILLRIDRID